MRRAFMTPFLLGLVLIMALFVFLATVNDENVVKEKVYSLKKLTDIAAITLAKHYAISGSQSEAEAISDAILLETPLGSQVTDTIEYVWDLSGEPQTVRAIITNYNQATFWYRFLNKENFLIDHVESQANILYGNLDQTTNLTPFAINGCNNPSLTPNSVHTLNLRGYNGYANDDFDKFYGIVADGEDCTLTQGNSKWSAFKNDVKDFSVEDDFLINNESYLEEIHSDESFCLPNVPLSPQEMQNDPKQIDQSMAHIDDLTVGTKMHIGVIECGSTADNILISNFLLVEFVALPFYKKNKDDYATFQFQLRILNTPSDGELVY
jgi:hypothetical protein